MSSPRPRRWVALVLLVSAGAQPALGGALLAVLLGLAVHGGHHEHGVSVSAREGRLHLVLEHEEGGHGHHPTGAHSEDPAASGAESDHVVLLPGDETLASPARRSAQDRVPPLVIAIAIALGVCSAPVPVPRAAHEPRGRSPDPLETVVLRL